MYFLSEEERRALLRRYLPQVREVPVSEELRGWNWSTAPLAPVYKAALEVSEVAGSSCATGRDVYLHRVLGEPGQPSRAMVQDAYYHAIVAEAVVSAKQAIYRAGVGCLTALEALEGTPTTTPPPGGSADTAAHGALLWRYESRRIAARAGEVLARLPNAGPDALAAAILPVTVDQQLDGSFLGLSHVVAIDAMHFSEPMVAALKFGRQERSHRIGLAGAALVLESLLEQPINLGYVAYVDFRDGHVVVEREFHVLGDELRQWFIDERDEKARSVELELDPGIAEECPEDCPYAAVCHAA